MDEKPKEWKWWVVVMIQLVGLLVSTGLFAGVHGWLGKSRLIDEVPLGMALLWGICFILLTALSLRAYAAYYQTKEWKLRMLTLEALGIMDGRHPEATIDCRKHVEVYRLLEKRVGFTPPIHSDVL
jgi:hypothetical protein